MDSLITSAAADDQEIKPFPTRAAKGSPRFKKIKYCIFLSGLSVFAQLYVFQPLLPTVAKHFGTSVGNSSLLVSASTIGMAMGLFFFGLKADGFSRKKQMAFALMASALLTILSFKIGSLGLLIAIGLIKGFVLAGVSSVALAYLTEEVELPAIGLAIGMYLNGNTIGGMSGRILAIIFEGAFGWQIAVLFIGIQSAVLALLFWKYFPKSQLFEPKHSPILHKLKQLGAFTRDPFLLRLYFIGALMVGCFVSIYNYLSFRLQEAPFNLNHFWIAFIFLMYAFGVIGAVVARKLATHFQLHQVLRGFLLLSLSGIGLMASDHLWLTIIGLGLMTMAFFAAHTMASRMVVVHVEEGKSAATSLYWLFYYTGSGLLGSISGYWLHATNWISYIVFLMVLLLVALFLTLSRIIQQQST